MGRVHGPGARLRMVIAVVGLLGATSPAAAQPARGVDRDAWLSRLRRALSEDQPDAAFERWVQDWHGRPGTGLAEGVRGAGRGQPGQPGAPLGTEFWDALGNDALGQVDGALNEALGRWAAAPTPENLGRVEALERVRDRMHGLGARGADAAAAEEPMSPHGRPVRDASGQVIGWDRDGDGVADLFDLDGDGVPDHFGGGSNRAAYAGGGGTTTGVGAAGAPGGTTRDVAGAFRASTTTRAVRATSAPAGAPGEARPTTGREPAPPARVDLPALGRLEGALREAREAAGRLEGALERSSARVAAAERVRDRTDAARAASAGLEAEARRVPAASRGAAVARLREGLAVAIDVEEQVGRCLRQCAGRGGLEQVVEVILEVGEALHEVGVAFWRAGQAVGAIDPAADPPARPGAAEEGAGTGTGFLVGDGRHVVTNAHVVGHAQVVEVQHGERTVSGQVVARDEALDLALVRVGASLGEPLRFGPAGRRPGVVVFAYGFGVLSARGDDASRCLTTRGSVAYLENGEIIFDAHVNPGNSGGPLVDARGCFVGVVVAKTVADATRGIDSVSIAVDGEVAVRWLSTHGVHATHEPGPPRGDLPPDADVRQAVVRIVRR
ncbi:MAG: trypsin-like peptidase domain-containing protein [Planctomycetes bacterium]|nr:trypsin-like peptidase domain-containing protein [Planctomycetota bacterium]